jgi:hypothetical protein
MPEVGGVFVSHVIRSFHLHQFDTALQRAALCIEILYVIFTVVFSIYVLHKMITQGSKFFRGFSNLNDLCLSLASITYVGAYIAYNVVLYNGARAIETFPFDRLSKLDACISCSLGIIALSRVVKGLTVLRSFSPAVAVLLEVLSRASRFIIALFVCWFFFLCALSVFVNLLFGAYVFDLSTISLAICSVLMATVRVYSYDALDNFIPAWAPLIFVSALAVFLILLHGIGVAIMCSSNEDFSRLRRSPTDRRLFGPFLNQLRSILGRSNRTSKAKNKKTKTATDGTKAEPQSVAAALSPPAATVQLSHQTAAASPVTHQQPTWRNAPAVDAAAAAATAPLTGDTVLSSSYTAPVSQQPIVSPAREIPAHY